MRELFNDDSPEEEEEESESLNINTDYAKNYNSWRQKEELHKLKTRYGENVNVSALIKLDEEDAESSSSSDDDEAVELNEDFEKTFYKTLACLKNKDPKIYDKDVRFFDTPVKEIKTEKTKDEGEDKIKKKEKPVFLRDYERKIIVEKGGKLSDDSDDENEVKHKPRNPTYVEEQMEIKDSFKKVFELDDEEEDLLKPKVKSNEEKQKDEADYKEWLKGQKEVIDEENQKNLKPLKDFWSDPNLDENEKFLRDYVLNKKFLDRESTNAESEYDKIAHDSDDDLSEDEKTIQQQEEFEHKYNFRFEEPDPEFIKRYPRTMKDCLRKKDTKRSQKRAEVKARKEQEKIRQQEELKQLKALKRKEIEEKLEKLKFITGNDDLNLDEIDIDGDFNPDEYDKKMKQIFNDDYYAEGVEDYVKPEFPEIDEELEIESTWDNYDPTSEKVYENFSNYNEPHCEDPEFNMDADYDGQKNLESEVVESVKTKKRRRRSKFAEVIAKEKPKFDPIKYPSAEKYYDEYYGLDYEDMIGDQPCRFKYRKVVPNDFGLTVEEILLADEKELNNWCSLKRTYQYRPEFKELNDIKTYKQKAANEALKRKILPSLYKPLEEEEEEEENKITNLQNQEQQGTKKKRKRKKKRQDNGELNAKESKDTVEKDETQNLAADQKIDEKINSESKKNKKKKRKLVESTIDTVESNSPKKRKKQNSQSETQTNDDSIEQFKLVDNNEISKKNKKPKFKNEENQSSEKKSQSTKCNGVPNSEDKLIKLETNDAPEHKFKKKSNNKNNPSNNNDQTTKSKKEIRKEIFKKRQKKKEKKTGDEPISHLSAERLKAYGFNPKKFKNKLKYGKRQ